MPLRGILNTREELNNIAKTIICDTRTIGADLDINDVLKNINICANYIIKKSKKRRFVGLKYK